MRDSGISTVRANGTTKTPSQQSEGLATSGPDTGQQRSIRYTGMQGQVGMPDQRDESILNALFNRHLGRLTRFTLTSAFSVQYLVQHVKLTMVRACGACSCIIPFLLIATRQNRAFLGIVLTDVHKNASLLNPRPYTHVIHPLFVDVGI